MTIRHAADCSFTHVSDAIDLMAAGDTMFVDDASTPCHWSSQLLKTLPTGSILDFNSSIIIDDFTSGTSPLMQFSLSGSDTLLAPTRIKNWEIRGGTGRADKAGTLTLTGSSHYFAVHDFVSNVQTYSVLGAGQHIQIYGDDMWGVIYHGTFYHYNDSNSVSHWGTSQGDDAWHAATNFGGQNFIFVEDCTDYGWDRGNGTSGGAINDASHGGRMVIRENNFCGGGGGGVGAQTHPTGGSGARARGGRAQEVYLNKADCSNSLEQFNMMFASSGCILFWGNPTNGGYTHQLTLHSDSRNNGTYGEALPSNSDANGGWGYCGPTSPQSGTVTSSGTGGRTITKTAGSNFSTSWTIIGTDLPMIWIEQSGVLQSYAIASVDSATQITLNATNLNTGLPVTLTPGTGLAYQVGSWANENANSNSGGRCIDQPGNGIGDLLSGDRPSTINVQTGADAVTSGFWPRQALEPVYEWKNTPAITTGAAVIVYEPSVLIENSTYYLHAGDGSEQVSNSYPFDGTVGTGHGTWANRPLTCTDGTAYWAKDLGTWRTGTSSVGVTTSEQGRLYACQAGSWIPIYEPYTYPHPLRGSNVETSSDAVVRPMRMIL